MLHFFHDLYKYADGGFIPIWTLPDKKTKWFGVHEIDKAVEYAMERSQTCDVYFGVGLHKTPQKSGRGEAKDVYCLTVVFVDFDIAKPGVHASSKLPRTEEELLEFIKSLPIPPSVIIRSGHGLHCYWFLDEPIMIETDADRQEAQSLLKGWEAYINYRAFPKGWEFDHVCELARVLRVPGTLNRKNPANPRRVEVVMENKNEHSPSHFREYQAPTTPSSTHSQGFLSESDRAFMDQGRARQDRFELPDEIPEGKRNATIFKYAASLRARGLKPEEIYPLLREANKRCQPPITDEEVRTISRSASQYPEGTSVQAEAAMSIERIQELQKSREGILSEEMMEYLVSLRETDEVKCQRLIADIRVEAKRYNQVRDFERMWKARLARETKEKFKREAAKEAEQRGVPIAIDDLPIDGFVAPGDWEVTRNYIRRVRIDKGTPIIDKACAHPVFITDKYRNMDEDTVKVKVLALLDDQWREFIVPASVVSSRTSIVALSNTGIQVTTENSRLLVQFLSEFMEVNRGLLLAKNSVGRLGWIGKEMFSPYAADIAFDGEVYYRDMFNAVKTCGSKGVWIQAAEEMRKDIFGRAILAASFAAPLVWLLGTTIFVVHLWGDTETGKTVGLYLSQSVWGNPKTLTKTFNSTSVGLERVAGFLHSLPLALDELQTIRDKSQIASLVYKLTEGKGKVRGTKEGGVEIEIVWGNVILTTGEEPITGDSTEGGAKNRVIEFEIKKPLFGGKARELVQAINENYGWGGMAYVEGLMAEYKSNPAGVKTKYHDFRVALAEHDEKNVSGEKRTDKQLNALAAMAVADLYSQHYVFGIDLCEAEDLTWEYMWSLYDLLETQSAIDQVLRGYESAIAYIAANQAHMVRGEEFRPPRLGYFTTFNGEKCAVVIAEELAKHLTTMNFNTRKMASGWLRRGLIIPGDGRHATSKRSIDGVIPRCYIIRLPAETENVEQLDF